MVYKDNAKQHLETYKHYCQNCKGGRDEGEGGGDEGEGVGVGCEDFTPEDICKFKLSKNPEHDEKRMERILKLCKDLHVTHDPCRSSRSKTSKGIRRPCQKR